MPSSEPIEAINLFRTLQWDDMLPGMFYFAAQLPKDAFLEGALRADGTLKKLSAAEVAYFIELRAVCIAVLSLARVGSAALVLHLWQHGV